MVRIIKIVNGLLSAGVAVCAACLSRRLPEGGDGRRGSLKAAGFGIRVLMLALYLDRISSLVIEGISTEGNIAEEIGIKGIISGGRGMNPDKAGESPLFFFGFSALKGNFAGALSGEEISVGEGAAAGRGYRGIENTALASGRTVHRGGCFFYGHAVFGKGGQSVAAVDQGVFVSLRLRASVWGSQVL